MLLKPTFVSSVKRVHKPKHNSVRCTILSSAVSVWGYLFRLMKNRDNWSKIYRCTSYINVYSVLQNLINLHRIRISVYVVYLIMRVSLYVETICVCVRLRLS